ncbi:uncharacterized [Tachysurus ichikawai]
MSSTNMLSVTLIASILSSFPRCLCDMLGVVDGADSGRGRGAGGGFGELVASVGMRRRGSKSDPTSSSHLLLAHFGVLLTADA